MTPVELVPLLSCWAGGVLLATAGRRYAAGRFTGVGLPFRQVLAAQFAGTALNRLVPAGGGLVAAHAGLLRRHDAERPRIGAALGGYAAGGVAAYAVLTAAALGLLGTGLVAFPTSPVSVPTPPWLWLGVAVGALGSVVAVVLRRRPGLVARLAVSTRAAAQLVRSQPGAVLRLAGFQVGTALLAAAGFWAALWATGTTLPALTVLAVYLLTSTLAAGVPAPGGTGPLEAGLIGGLALVGVGFVPAAAAVALFRLVTHWLPVPLGLLAGAGALRRRARPRLPARAATVLAA